jgi:hypothetical protein
MKRIIDGKSYTFEQETRKTGNKYVRGTAVYEGSGVRRKFVGFTYKKADGWYGNNSGNQIPQHYGGGLMKDAVKSMLYGRK